VLPWPDIGHLAKWSVSSFKFGFGPECLQDHDPDTFWQSVQVPIPSPSPSPRPLSSPRSQTHNQGAPFFFFPFCSALMVPSHTS